MAAKMSKLESELRDLRRRRPFQPFTIKFKDGDAFDIPKPFQFGVLRGENRGMFLHPKRGLVFFRLDNISQLTVNASRRRGNGRA
jgi:hypothetical protein